MSSDSDQKLSEQHDPGKVHEPDIGSSPNLEKPKKDDTIQPEIAPPQESDMQKEWKKLKPIISTMPKEIIHKCLFNSFSNYNDIKYNFYDLYFENFCKELREEDGYTANIWRLIKYCNERGITEDLWLYIKEKRENQYNTYYPKWKQAMLEHQKSQEGSENMRAVDSIDQYKPGSVTREKPLAPYGEGQAHPLSPLSGNNRLAINDWFFNELTSQEKSMVLTVALFEQINRKHMIPISQEIERRLFETT